MEAMPLPDSKARPTSTLSAYFFLSNHVPVLWMETHPVSRVERGVWGPPFHMQVSAMWSARCTPILPLVHRYTDTSGDPAFL